MMADLPNEGAIVDATPIVSEAATQMRAAREAVGMTLQDVAQKTRVPLRHLISMEAGDFAALPGTTYCAGFARSFARAVGMDETALVAQLREEIDDLGGLGRARYEIEEAVDPARVPPRWLAWVGVVAVILLAGGYGIWRTQMMTPPTDEQLAQPAVAPVNQKPANASVAPTPPVTGPVVMTAADKVWIRIYQADGTRLFEGILGVGQSYTVPANARDPMIMTGRPDVLGITVGGQSIPPLGTAERTISDVPISAAALLARAKQPVAAEDAALNNGAASVSAPAPAPAPVRSPRLSMPAARAERAPAAAVALPNMSPTQADSASAPGSDTGASQTP